MSLYNPVISNVAHVEDKVLLQGRTTATSKSSASNIRMKAKRQRNLLTSSCQERSETEGQKEKRSGDGRIQRRKREEGRRVKGTNDYQREEGMKG